MTGVRRQIISNRRSNSSIVASAVTCHRGNAMELERTYKDKQEMDIDPTDERDDLLTPLLSISGSSNKESILQSFESEPVIVVQREVSKLGLFTVTGIAIVLIQVCCEVIKQVSNYSLQYYNEGRFPIPQTVIVISIALVKLFGTVLRAKGKWPISKQGVSFQTFRSSLRFLVPAILYGINNNLYLFGLTLVSPPILTILYSFKSIITASTYKFFLKRPISRRQFFGCFVIVISLVVAKLHDILQIINNKSDYTVITIVADMGNSGNSTDTMQPESTVNIQSSNDADTPSTNAVPFLAIILAVAASCNSVVAALYTEHLFKSNSVKGETFLDQQFWMYFYESLVVILLHYITNSSYSVTSLTSDLLGMSSNLQVVLFIAIMCGSIGGIVVASILKLLDNIVKEYSISTANILTAVACAILFPDKFEFTVYVMLSMACLFTGIYLYESRKVNVVISVASSETTETTRKPKD